MDPALPRKNAVAAEKRVRADVRARQRPNEIVDRPGRVRPIDLAVTFGPLAPVCGKRVILRSPGYVAAREPRKQLADRNGRQTLDAGIQRPRVVVFRDWEGALPDDVAAVDSIGQEKKREAALGEAFDECPHERVASAVAWQQCRMRSDAAERRQLEQLRRKDLGTAEHEDHVGPQRPNERYGPRVANAPKPVTRHAPAFRNRTKIDSVTRTCRHVNRRRENADNVGLLAEHLLQTVRAKIDGAYEDNSYHPTGADSPSQNLFMINRSSSGTSRIIRTIAWAASPLP